MPWLGSRGGGDVTLALRSGRHYQRTNRLDICVLSFPNNTNSCNQNWQSLPKYRPAWNISSQHSDYHLSGFLQDIVQKTASHSSRC